MKAYNRDNNKVLDGGDEDIGDGFQLGNGKKTYGIGRGSKRLGVSRVDGGIVLLKLYFSLINQ